jgi:hypothetical protein
MWRARNIDRRKQISSMMNGLRTGRPRRLRFNGISCRGLAQEGASWWIGPDTGDCTNGGARHRPPGGDRGRMPIEATCRRRGGDRPACQRNFRGGRRDARFWRLGGTSRRLADLRATAAAFGSIAWICDTTFAILFFDGQLSTVRRRRLEAKGLCPLWCLHRSSCSAALTDFLWRLVPSRVQCIGC